MGEAGSRPPMARFGSPRLGGLALMLASLAISAGNLLHPRAAGGGLGAESIEAEARIVVDNLAVWYPSHLLLLVFPPLALLGFLTLYAMLVVRGERSLSALAILSQSLAGVLFIVALVMDGLVSPFFAQRYLAAADGAKQSALAVFEYNYFLSLFTLAPAFFLYTLGYGLLGGALVRARLFDRRLAWAGAILGAIGVVGYIAGVFGPYWVLSPNFPPYAVLLAVWILVVGVLLYRAHE